MGWRVATLVMTVRKACNRSMSAAAVWFGADLRARWRTALGLCLLMGVAVGACLTAAAGARRTGSAYPRFLAKYGAFHAEVSTDNDPRTDQIFDEIAHFPQVVNTSRSSLFFGTLTARGHVVSFPDVLLVAAHEADGSGAGDVKVVRGRLPDPTAVEEAVAGYVFAERLGLKPGDRMTVSVAPVDPERGTPGRGASETQQLRLVGVVAAVGSFETLTGRGFPHVVVLTPAFFRAHRPATFSNADTMAVALRHGEADLPAFTEELRRRDIPLTAPPQPASVYTSDVQAVNRVPVVTLWAAAGLLAVATMVIVGQALARETLAQSNDFPTLHAVGMSRNTLTGASAGKAVLIGVGGAAVGVAVAVLCSPLMPLGLARVAEPDPGFDADWLVLGVGAAAVLVAISAVSLLVAHRGVRRATMMRFSRPGRRPSAITSTVARAGLPTPMTSGVRLATRASGPAEPVPVRTAFVGTAFSIAAVTAALVFASSLEHLVREPRLVGSSWDAAVIADPADLDDLAGSLPHDVAEQWKGTAFASTQVDGQLLGAYASDGSAPSIIQGRSPRGADEVVLDPRTLHRLHKGLGDTVNVASPEDDQDQASASLSRPMRIVGSFAVPRFPFQSDENPGQGAAFTPDGLASISRNFAFDALYIKFRAGVDPIDAVQRLKDETADRAFAVMSTQPVGAVRGVQRLSTAPWYLAGVLTIVAIGTLAHTLLLATRRRRRDLAILRTLGFVGRQLRQTVAWLAFAIVAPALMLGLPVGIAVGRRGWRQFAEYLAVVPEPAVPAAGILLIVLTVLAVTKVIATGAPGNVARIRPATVLRCE